MRESYLIAGGSMIGLEFLSFLGFYLINAINWTTSLLITLTVVGIFFVFNLTALIFVLIGLLSKE